jgi:hypothetical protein
MLEEYLYWLNVISMLRTSWYPLSGTYFRGHYTFLCVYSYKWSYLFNSLGIVLYTSIYPKPSNSKCLLKSNLALRYNYMRVTLSCLHRGLFDRPTLYRSKHLFSLLSPAVFSRAPILLTFSLSLSLCLPLSISIYLYLSLSLSISVLSVSLPSIYLWRQVYYLKYIYHLALSYQQFRFANIHLQCTATSYPLVDTVVTHWKNNG